MTDEAKKKIQESLIWSEDRASQLYRKASPNNELIMIYDSKSSSKQQIDQDLWFRELLQTTNWPRSTIWKAPSSDKSTMIYNSESFFKQWIDYDLRFEKLL